MAITVRNSNYLVRIPIGRISTLNGVDDGFKIGSAGFANNVQNGFNDSDYRNKVARHQNASLAYSRRRHKVFVPQLQAETLILNGSNSIGRGRGFSHGNLFAIEEIPSRPLADDKALKSIKGKLARDVESFKALVPLAELKETRGLLRSVSDTTGSLLKELIAIKRGRGSPRRLLREASKAWLTFSFGISPTISDINALSTSIGSVMNRSGQFVRLYGTGSEEWNEVAVRQVFPDTLCSGARITSNGRVRINHSYSVRYTAGLLLEALSGNEYGLLDHFGLTFGDLPSVGWELIPFSWVVDYFTTTGAYMEDLFYTMPGNTVYLTKSVKYKATIKSDVWIEPSSGSWKITSGSQPTTATCESFMFSRTNLSALPHRSFRFKTVDEIGVNSFKRVLNLASILLSK